MNRTHWLSLSLALIALGLSIFFYKLFALHFPLFPDSETSVWMVETHISFQANKDKPVKASLHIPRSSRNIVILDENFISRGYGLTTSTSEGNRLANWSIRQANGEQNLFYRAVIRYLDTPVNVVSSKGPNIEEPNYEGPYLTAAEGLLAECGQRSADTTGMVQELIKRIISPQTDENAALLLGHNNSLLNRAKVITKVLALARMPSRVVNGIRLDPNSPEQQVIQWLEVLEDSRWISFNLGDASTPIPQSYIPWWKGTDSLFDLEGGRSVKSSIAVVKDQASGIQVLLDEGRKLYPLLFEFSLFSLPIQTQAVYHIILLIPLGAFLIVLLRNIVGLKTFGTFMPVLIALAFRETHLIWGIVLFTTVVSVGLLARSYLEHFKLLLVPRLGAVLTIVVMVMAGLSILTHKLGIDRGLSLALFPMVILTMTIERVSIVWDELGAAMAIRQAFGSLVAASLVFLIITSYTVQHIMFVFPELLLILLAFNILLGRYTGYRLSELMRFKSLTKDA